MAAKTGALGNLTTDIVLLSRHKPVPVLFIGVAPHEEFNTYIAFIV